MSRINYCIFLMFISLSFQVKAAETNTASNIERLSPVTSDDYWQLPSRQIDQALELDQLQQVADIEVFYWYGCEPCMKVEQMLDQIKRDNPELVIKRTPLIPFSSWRPQAYIQPLLTYYEGKIQIPSRDEVYLQCIDDCGVFNSFESIKSWLQTKYQVSNLPSIDESKIWAAEKSYRQRAKSFSITQVPTIIIKEQYVTDANTAKTLDKLNQIIVHLLTQ